MTAPLGLVDVAAGGGWYWVAYAMGDATGFSSGIAAIDVLMERKPTDLAGMRELGEFLTRDRRAAGTMRATQTAIVLALTWLRPQ